MKLNIQGFVCVTLAFVCTIFTGCERPVDGKELVGVWKPDANAKLAFRITKVDQPSILVLNTDASFKAEFLPCSFVDDVDNVDTCKGGPMSGSGTWKLSKDGPYQTVELTFSPQRKMVKDSSRLAFSQIKVERKGKDPNLFTWENGEDSQRLEWTRS